MESKRTLQALSTRLFIDFAKDSRTFTLRANPDRLRIQGEGLSVREKEISLDPSLPNPA